MNSKFYQTAIIILFICNIFLFHLLQKNQKETKNKDSITQFIIDKEHENYLRYESIDENIFDTFVYWGNKKKECLKIDQLSSSPKLIFRYSTTMCKPCINEVISAIQKVFPNYTDNDNIIFTCKNLENV